MNKLTITRFPQLSFAGGEAINSLCTNQSRASVRMTFIVTKDLPSEA